MASRRTSLAVLFIAWAAPMPAHAQPANEEAKQKAKTLVAQALQAFEAKRFEEAGRLYLDAFEVAEKSGLGARPELLYNAGLAFEETRACDRVAELFVRFLVAAPESASSSDFVERLERARTCAPEVTITSAPVGARVVIDGAERGVTPLKVHLKNGEHMLEMALKGHGGLKQSVFIEAGKPIEVARTLDPEPSRPGVADPPNVASVDMAAAAGGGAGDFDGWMWLAGGTGAIAGVVGGSLLALELGAAHRARGAEEDRDLGEYERSRSAALRFAYGARASFAVAGAAAIALALLASLDPSETVELSAPARGETSAPRTAPFPVAVHLAPGRAVIDLAW